MRVVCVAEEKRISSCEFKEVHMRRCCNAFFERWQLCANIDDRQLLSHRVEVASEFEDPRHV